MNDPAPGVTLSILVGRPDTEYLGAIISHLVRGCRFPFARRLLIVDTLPPLRATPAKIVIDQNLKLLSECQKLRSIGIIDEICELGSDSAFTERVERKHFGKPLGEHRDYRGIPLLGWVYGMEMARTDYVLHFDSDILLHQAPDYDWIAEAQKLMESIPEILFISPLPGPPTEDGSLIQRTANYSVDPRGFYSFKTFSSRRFLVDRRRLQNLLPLKAVRVPWSIAWKRRLRSLVTGKGALWQWENMMSTTLQRGQYVRAHLRSPKAWTLHPPDHSPRFVNALPEIIRRIERGDFPAGQAGKYDLELEAWV